MRFQSYSSPNRSLFLFVRVLGSEGLRVGDEEQEEVEGVNMMDVLERPARQEERRKVDERKRVEMDRRLRSRFKEMKMRGEDEEMMKMRRKLPAWEERSKIVKLLRTNQVVVISGMTGCGKSTQVPQFLLDDWLYGDSPAETCNVICTQPRRISAIGVATRVAQVKTSFKKTKTDN